jgi:hypothetical protein
MILFRRTKTNTKNIDYHRQWMYLATPPTNPSTNGIVLLPHEYSAMYIPEAAARCHWLKNLWAESLDTSITGQHRNANKAFLL